MFVHISQVEPSLTSVTAIEGMTTPGKTSTASPRKSVALPRGQREADLPGSGNLSRALHCAAT